MKLALSYHYSASRDRGALRSRAGQQLIELIFAVAITGFLAAVMSTSLSQTLATSVAAENRMTAAHVAQELLDRIRDCPYAELPASGSVQVPMYSDDGVSSSGYSFTEHPLLMDMSANYTWSPEAPYNRLGATNGQASGNPTAFVGFSPGQSSTSTFVSITISWHESNNQKTLTLNSTVSSSGILQAP